MPFDDLGGRFTLGSLLYKFYFYTATKKLLI